MKKVILLFVTMVIAFAITIPASASGVSAKPTAAATTAAVQSLTVEEEDGLLFMYEEEKLARDVYNYLYALWGQRTFQKIALSEQTHMDAIQTLLVRYGVPVPENPPGVYDDLGFKTLYDDLTANGSLSLADALKVGATIEEIDILDLQSRLKQTNKNDIQQVYSNLLKASYNHLRSFVKVLFALTGEIYEPQYLDTDAYLDIIEGVNGRGKSHANTMGAGPTAGSDTGNDMTGNGTCSGDCTCDGSGSGGNDGSDNGNGNGNRSGKP